MSAMLEIRAPADQSEGTRSQILRWLKSVGQTVAENEPLIEVETDKVTVEIASPGAGVLCRILKEEQSEIEPGDVLGLIAPEMPAEAPATAADGASSRAPEHSAAHPEARQRSAPPLSDTASSAGNPSLAGRPPSAVIATSTALSPAVRRLLNEHGIEPAAVRGTGQGGRITIDDVLSHIATSTTSLGQAATGDTQRPAPPRSGVGLAAEESAVSSVNASGIRRVPHSPVRKRVAEHMVHSLLHTAPHVTSVFEADMTAVLAHRERYREELSRSGAPLTLTVYFLAAAVDAIRAVPEANSRWTDDALEVFETMNIGVATALGDQGLVVPVMQRVETRSLREIAVELQALVARAREGRLTPADVRGGTFTISNHGVSGSLLAAPIVIHQPQSAILGVGKVEHRVVPLGQSATDGFAVRPKCYVTLTIDHRVMDGHRANLFLRTLVRRMESWPTDGIE